MHSSSGSIGSGRSGSPEKPGDKIKQKGQKNAHQKTGHQRKIEFEPRAIHDNVPGKMPQKGEDPSSCSLFQEKRQSRQQQKHNAKDKKQAGHHDSSIIRSNALRASFRIPSGNVISGLMSSRAHKIFSRELTFILAQSQEEQAGMNSLSGFSFWSR